MLRTLSQVLRSRALLRNRSGPSGPPKSFLSRGYSKEAKRNHLQAKQFLNDKESERPRKWGIYLISAGLIVAAGAVATVKYNDERRAILKGSNPCSCPQRNRTKRLAIGGPFKLVDTNNNLVTNADFLGNWVLVYFGYTSSPDVGPEELQKMAKAINILEYEHNIKIKPIFITIDPQRDTPDQLRKYLREFDPRIEGLTGQVDAVRQVAREYRVYFKKVDEQGQDYLIECSNNMYLLDQNMEVVECFGVEYDSLQLASAIAKGVSDTSK